MKYYFVFKKYKYVNLFMFDFDKQVKIYKDSKKINDYVYKYNKVFDVDYQMSIGSVELDFNEVKKINGYLYLDLNNEAVKRKINAVQRIEIIG